MNKQKSVDNANEAAKSTDVQQATETSNINTSADMSSINVNEMKSGENTLDGAEPGQYHLSKGMFPNSNIQHKTGSESSNTILDKSACTEGFYIKLFYLAEEVIYNTGLLESGLMEVMVSMAFPTLVISKRIIPQTPLY